MIFYIILLMFVGCFSPGSTLPGSTLKFDTKSATYTQSVQHKSLVDDAQITTTTILKIINQNDTNNNGVRIKVVTENENNEVIGSAKVIGNVMTVTMDDGTTETFTLSEDDLSEVRQWNLESNEVMRSFDRANRTIDEDIEIDDINSNKRQMHISVKYDDKGREVYSKISKKRTSKIELKLKAEVKSKNKKELREFMDNLDSSENNVTRSSPLLGNNPFDAEIIDIDGVNEDYTTITTYDHETEEITEIVDEMLVDETVILTSTITRTEQSALSSEPAIT